MNSDDLVKKLEDSNSLSEFYENVKTSLNMDIPNDDLEDIMEIQKSLKEWVISKSEIVSPSQMVMILASTAAFIASIHYDKEESLEFLKKACFMGMIRAECAKEVHKEQE